MRCQTDRLEASLGLRVPDGALLDMQTSVTCPACGMKISGNPSICPLCQARIRPITLRRMGLWALVAVVVLVALIVWATR